MLKRPPTRAPGEAGTSAVDPVGVLLVDDLEENLVALRALLDVPGLDLLSARSGDEALELLLDHEVALALLDVQMPGMDGFELAELMRSVERTRHVPIIFITAGARETHRIFQGYDAGAVDFLFKPVEARILKHKVETFVSLHRQRLQLAAQLGEIKQLNQRLAATLSLNERFVAAVGHDLRTPLNSILIATESMRTRRLEDTAQKHVERIHSAAQRMGKMIGELFDLARARQGGGIPVRREDEVSLLQVTERAVTELQTAAPERSIEVHHRGDLTGRWDSVRLCQVVSNLLGNALKHGRPGCPVNIDLDGTEKGEVRLDVASGGEISREALPTLFEPFRRGEDRSASDDGLGLGLFIVKEVVTAHGGRIEAETRDGTTRFQVRLPRR
jgi:signal transduction histidine kinase